MGLALVYPGQGAQSVGMGTELAQQYPSARRILDEADQILGFSLSDIIAHGPDDELTRTDISQPAILVMSWMAHTVLTETVEPLQFDCTAGLSLGEYTALIAAGALDFENALRLVRVRGEAMQAASEARAGGMVALIGADEASANSFCDAVRQGDEVLQVANLNSAGQVVIAGDQAACDRAVDAAKEHGIRRAMPLKVAGAFHTAHMAPAAERLGEALAFTPFSNARVPVYANATAEAVTEAATIRELLIRQLTEPVRFAASVEAMHATGITTFWELGPGKTLGGMISRTVKDVSCANVATPEDALALALAKRAND
ncbi:MAG: ACP S-malonyltransferase [Planctomycetota bacterium]|jgi:[acyl-carrier-protein] S-malonyltransferase|nr:ACP S-malonyltransferase [Planctomycetota bacterium]